MQWGHLERPWQICIEEAWAGYCAGSLPIGAVIADTHDRIIARGRNRVFETHALEGVLAGTRLAHAEMNALAAVAHTHIDLATCTLYTTTEPCPMCIGAIRISHVGRVRYMLPDPIAGSTNFLHANPFMQARTCAAMPLGEPALEALIAALYVDWVLRNGASRIIAGLDLIAQQSPEGVALGQHLFDHQIGQHLHAQGKSAAVMFAILMPMLADSRNT